jgi:hypothetical protein
MDLMPSITERSLVLELRHNGEHLVLHRARDSRGIEELHLSGTLPARREGPPLRIHAFEDEHGQVLSGTLSASLDGKAITIGPGGSARWMGLSGQAARSQWFYANPALAKVSRVPSAVTDPFGNVIIVESNYGYVRRIRFVRINP